MDDGLYLRGTLSDIRIGALRGAFTQATAMRYWEQRNCNAWSVQREVLESSLAPEKQSELLSQLACLISHPKQQHQLIALML
jgi:hypothetical protein